MCFCVAVKYLILLSMNQKNEMLLLLTLCLKCYICIWRMLIIVIVPCRFFYAFIFGTNFNQHIFLDENRSQNTLKMSHENVFTSKKLYYFFNQKQIIKIELSEANELANIKITRIVRGPAFVFVGVHSSTLHYYIFYIMSPVIFKLYQEVK